jgi:uncharacterized protein YjbI with pentapeptide repeats
VRARLERADLRSARMGGANLTEASIEEADFGGAYLEGTSLLCGNNLGERPVQDRR